MMMRAEAEGQRVVIRGLGTASPRIRHALRQLLPLPEAELARRLYQAPSELVGGLTPEVAETLVGALRDAGLDVEILAENVAFTPGSGSCELALGACDPARLPEVVALVAEVVDTDLAAATRLVWASPPILLGGLSESVVAALCARFANLGATLLVSRAEKAAFDVFLTDPAGRANAVRALAQAGVPVLEAGPLLATALDRVAAGGAWDRLSRAGAPARVVNRDFLRYDVRLDGVDDPGPVALLLTAACGVPEALVGRLLARLPIVVLRDATLEEATALLEQIGAAGGRATAHLATFQTFDLVVESAADSAAAAAALAAGAGLSLAEAQTALRTLPARVVGPWTGLAVRWIQHTLKAAGCKARLELR